MKFERFYFYTWSGIFSALIGWSLSQIFLIDFGNLLGEESFLANLPPDLILLPIVAACLAVAMVVTEIFLSNPTRYKSNRRVLPPYLWLALVLGTAAGLVSSFFTWGLYASKFPDWVVRMTPWTLIGLFIGLDESISWRLRSIEGQTRKATERILKVVIFGASAGLAAAVIVEMMRPSIAKGYEDPFGFLILGLSLGLFLSFATSPSYQVALRAGAGFEAIDPRQARQADSQVDRPRIQKDLLKFVTADRNYDIEEGLSIQLPEKARELLSLDLMKSRLIFIYLISPKCVLH